MTEKKLKMFWTRSEMSQVIWTSMFIGIVVGMVIGFVIGWFVA